MNPSEIAVVVALMAPLSLVLVWVLPHQPAGRPFVLVNGVKDVLLVAVTVLATMTLHELVHGAAYRLLGCRVAFVIVEVDADEGHVLDSMRPVNADV